MREYAERNFSKVDKKNEYEFLKTLAGNCNCKGIPKNIFVALVMQCPEFKYNEVMIDKAADYAYSFLKSNGSWIEPHDIVGDDLNPVHPRKKEDENDSISISKKDFSNLLDIRETFLDYVPFLSYNEKLKKYILIVYQYINRPKKTSEIIEFCKAINLNSEQAFFVLTHLEDLGVTYYEEEKDVYRQLTLDELIPLI
jgi:hypothetical protein